MAKEPDRLGWLEIVRMLASLFAALGALASLAIEAPIRAFRREREKREEIDRRDAELAKLNLQPDVEHLRRSLELRVAAANFPDKAALIDLLTSRFMEFELPKHQCPYPTKSVWEAYLDLAWQLYQDESFNRVEPPRYTDEVGRARYADYLLAFRRKIDDPKEAVRLFVDAVTHSFISFAKALPASAYTMHDDGSELPSLARIALLETLTDVPDLISSVLAGFFMSTVKAISLFDRLRAQIDECDARSPTGALPEPSTFRGTTTQLLDTYLGGTPIRAIFDVTIPFRIKPEDRLEHWHLLAPTGWGKTQTLQHVIYHDITGPDPPALVIIEPKGDMVAAIQKLKVFADQPERLVVIDPELNPALNMFAIPRERLSRYSQTVQEQIEASVIEQYAYIFSALDADMSRKQATALSYVVKLVFSMRGTIRDFIKILDDPSKEIGKSPFQDDIRKLDDIAQSFFEAQFFNAQAFGITRRSLAAKLYGLLTVPAFNRMFSASSNHLDMFERLQTPGSVTVVNTAKGLLKREASSLFGRYMIAQTTSAAFERVAIPERDRKPAYLIIDEAGSYFDDSLEELLAEVRSMGLGVVFAHQLMSQLKTRPLKSSVQGNTSIKFAAPSEEDAADCASVMRTSADFLRSMRQTKGKATQFGVFIRGETPTAVRVQIPFLTMESAPQMTADEHEAFRARIRARYSDGAATVKMTAPAPSSAPSRSPPAGPPDDTVHSKPSTEW